MQQWLEDPVRCHIDRPGIHEPQLKGHGTMLGPRPDARCSHEEMEHSECVWTGRLTMRLQPAFARARGISNEVCDSAWAFHRPQAESAAGVDVM